MKTNMALYMKQRRKNRRDNLILISGGKCVVCGSTDDLEFDHRDKKTKSFGLSGSGLDLSWDLIISELKKCDLLCNGCHKTKTKLHGDRSYTPTVIKKPFVHGSARTYSELPCRCGICTTAKQMYRFKRINYSDCIC